MRGVAAAEAIGELRIIMRIADIERRLVRTLGPGEAELAAEVMLRLAVAPRKKDVCHASALGPGQEGRDKGVRQVDLRVHIDGAA